jgi:hypothetical protein
MRKIDKSIHLATSYQAWVKNFNDKGHSHVPYSSKHKYYMDIVGNLLWVQKGLCAYTEMYLSDITTLDPTKWKAGRIAKFDFMGHLDHYDCTLKDSKGWEWSNFFVAHSDVNVKHKGAKKVNSLLKPDSPSYEPFFYLQYDFKTHNFLPNVNREDGLQDQILEDINALGLNYKPIIDYRKEYLVPIIDDVLLGKKSIKDAHSSLFKFYTAFEMIAKSVFGIEL